MDEHETFTGITGMVEIYRIHNAGTKGHYSEKWKKYLYTRTYEISGGITCAEAERVLREVFRANPEREVVNINWGWPNRVLHVHWQQDNPLA